MNDLKLCKDCKWYKKDWFSHQTQFIQRIIMKQHPANDWEWADDAEEGFVEWFNDFYGRFSFRDENFYEDCEVEDEKTRKDLLYKWIHAAYVAGYERGLYGKLEEEQE